MQPSVSQDVAARDHSAVHVNHDVLHPNNSRAHSAWAQDQTLHVAAVYSNPRRWRTRRFLFNDFRRHMEQLPNIKLYVVEVAFGDRPFEVTTANHPLDLQLRTSHELWVKEAALNLMIQKFSPDWRYGAYCDGDFHFTRYDVGLETIHQLQHHHWVQMFSSYCDLSPDHHPMRVINSFAHRFSTGSLTKELLAKYRIGDYYYTGGKGIGATGGAWAFRREAFNDCGGLLDTCILGCYDDQTEVFTDRGWLPFADLTLYDRVLSLSPDKVAEWQPVTKLHRYPYDGPMKRFKSQSVDLVVTPNHRMVYEKNDSLYFEEASDFKQSKASRKVPKNQRWSGVVPDTLPVAIDVSIEDWVAFIGLWLAEGWTYLATDKGTGCHHYRIGIAQKPGKKRDRISSLLNRFPISWNESVDGFVGNHKGLFTFLSSLGKRSWEKRIPDDIKELPSGLLEIFLEWYMLGDGNVDKARKPNHTDSRRMFTTSPFLKDDLLEVIIKTGCWGSYRERAPRTSQPLKCGRSITARRVGYDIWIHRGEAFHLKGRHVSESDYSGEVFCCETPYHTLLVRRNGKMIWCGNSGDWHMAFGLVGEPDQHPTVSEITKCGARYADSIKIWQTRAAQVTRKNVGVVPGHAIHYFHGSKQRRGYGERWKILRDNDFDPYRDLFRDSQGLYQIVPDKIALRDDIRRYFKSRCEDDISLLEGDSLLGD